MRFRYAFQQIVDLKGNERTQAEWVLGEAVGRLNVEQSTLQELEAEKARMQDQLSAGAEQVMSISQMQAIQHYVSHLERQIAKKLDDVRRAQHCVEERQQALEGKMLDEKVWTKAREKAQQLHELLMLKKEQEELDEIASVRFARPSL
ncbi:flagellar export protein FliJ [Gordoniibacillus kamchatkensis]|uniref:Flagellar FliJ protein n=1 Tax=Gordoniibacillus kamchatkensis TaxID=1590651 RepID=A0ABR5AE01_9BACL|nr:flagellar export protein FliJ [Paenibacillus sp. VKM B-2647]KIL39244.1 flagellar export protein FliJ [Paenibacillus sp. VKM B-2647]